MKLKVILVILITLPVLGLPFYLPRIIKVRKINCKSQFGECQADIKEKLQTNANKDLYFSKKSTREILDNEISIEKYSLHFKLPSILEVYIIEEKPVFALKKSGDNPFFLVEKNGKVLSSSDSSDLPTLEGQNLNFNVGDKVEEETLFSLKIIRDLNELYDIKKAVLEENGLFIKITNGPEVIFPKSGDEKVLVGSVRLILSQLNTDKQNSRIDKAASELTVDLRYENPVIR